MLFLVVGNENFLQFKQSSQIQALLQWSHLHLKIKNLSHLLYVNFWFHFLHAI